MTLDLSAPDLSRYAVRDDDDDDPELLLMPGGEVVDTSRLSNASSAFIDMNVVAGQPCVASIYQLDSLVRRASSLQLTADGRAAQGAHA